jgi:hypothetical protein
MVHVMVNDKGPFTMMLDTGTDPSAVDFSTARDLGLDRRHTEDDTPGVRRSYQLKLARVALGAVVASNVAAVATNLSDISKRLGVPLHGVLGHSFLSGRIVQIDYPKRVVRFYSVSPISARHVPQSPEYVMMPFRYDDNVLVDDVRVNGHAVTANLDTGSDGGFSFTPKAVFDLGLEADLRNARPATSLGYAGARNNFEGPIESSVTIGAIRVAAPNAVFFGKGTGHDHKPWGLNIGNEFLKSYVVTIDYKAKAIVLERP